MKNSITKEDWDKFRKSLPEWQEKYMDGLIAKYQHLLDQEMNSSEKIHELKKMLDQDMKHPGVYFETRSKEELPFYLCRLIAYQVISMKDLNVFSEELIQEVKRQLI